MSVDHIPHPAKVDGSFAHLRLGRLPVKHDPRTFILERYVEPHLPVPPVTVDLTAAVPTWPMYGNDELGDCTCAAAGHMIQGWTANAGKQKIPHALTVEHAYWQTGTPPSDHGDPGGQTDTGRNEIDVLNYWRHHGIGESHKISAYASIDPDRLDLIEAAIWLFGGVYTGISLPKTAQGQTIWDVVGDGRTGDSEPGSWGGHAVPYLAYASGAAGPIQFKCVTWGGVLELTADFHRAYCEEVYAIVSHDFLHAGKTVDGFDLEQLTADLAAL